MKKINVKLLTILIPVVVIASFYIPVKLAVKKESLQKKII